jgi:hypothetical protein
LRFKELKSKKHWGWNTNFSLYSLGNEKITGEIKQVQLTLGKLLYLSDVFEEHKTFYYNSKMTDYLLVNLPTLGRVPCQLFPRGLHGKTPQFGITQLGLAHQEPPNRFTAPSSDNHTGVVITFRLVSIP